MIYGKPIEKGFVSRWSLATLERFENMHLSRHIGALIVIFAMTFLAPGWPMLTQMTAYFSVSLILALVLFDKNSESIEFIKNALPAVVGLSVVSAFFNAGMHFLFPKMDSMDAFWQSIDWMSAGTKEQLMRLNLIFNQDLPQSMCQSPAMAALIYLAGRKGPVPKMNMEYLVTFSMVFGAALQSMAATILVIIMGEFVVRTSYVVLSGMAHSSGFGSDLMFMTLYTVIAWIVFIPTSFYIKELIDGPTEVKRRKKENKVPLPAAT